MENSTQSREVSIKPKNEASEDVVVAGSLAIDFSCDYRPLSEGQLTLSMVTSNPAVITQSLGGVGRNVATAAHVKVPKELLQFAFPLT